MNKITCTNCKRLFKVKMLFWGYRTQCPYCNNIIDFNRTGSLTAFNFIFTVLMTGGAIISVPYFVGITKLPHWISVLLAIIVFSIIFIPTHKSVTCYIYNKANKIEGID